MDPQRGGCSSAARRRPGRLLAIYWTPEGRSLNVERTFHTPAPLTLWTEVRTIVTPRAVNMSGTGCVRATAYDRHGESDADKLHSEGDLGGSCSAPATHHWRQDDWLEYPFPTNGVRSRLARPSGRNPHLELKAAF